MMVSATLTFDRLAYIDRLTSGGIGEEQARTHAAALDSALRDSVATKSDVETLGRDLRTEIADLGRELRSEMAELRADLNRSETRLDAKIETSAAALKVDILRWLLVTQAALGGFTFAMLKFLH